MKAKQQTRDLWTKIESQITIGQFPEVFINRAGNICLVKGAANPTLPSKIAALLPAAVVERARVAAADRAAEERAKSLAYAEELHKRRESLEARGTGFVLLAGENTTIVHRGTYGECLANVWQVTRCKRDTYSGKGCWIICDPDGIEVESGTFDRDGYL